MNEEYSKGSETELKITRTEEKEELKTLDDLLAEEKALEAEILRRQGQLDLARARTRAAQSLGIIDPTIAISSTEDVIL